jgi:hypothetical protein
MSAFITINYNEGNKKDLGYESVELHYSHNKNEKKLFFNTGNFIKDWYDMNKFINMELLGNVSFISYSSSVNHFIMDGAPYDSAYLHIIDEKPILKYLNHSDPNWWMNTEDMENSVEFFVPENTQPTWEELKEMCK